MYRIALCDDETVELEKEERMLSDYENTHPDVEFVTRCFENADELCCMVKEEGYMPDIIFMDIYMPDESRESFPLGIKKAKELRKANYQGKLVFCTTSREYALEAFDVDAVQYMVKPVEAEKLSSVLDGLLMDIEEERNKYVVLKVDGDLVRVSLNDIVYVEARGKTQEMFLINGTRYLLHMTMQGIFDLLSNYKEFVRIGVAFIVNLGYVGCMNAKEVHMDNGIKIYLPRGTYKGLRESYFNYYCRERA